MPRYERNVHGSGKYTDQSQPLKEMTFRHPFSMMVTGPRDRGKGNGLENCYFPR